METMSCFNALSAVSVVKNSDAPPGVGPGATRSQGFIDIQREDAYTGSDLDSAWEPNGGHSGPSTGSVTSPPDRGPCGLPEAYHQSGPPTSEQRRTTRSITIEELGADRFPEYGAVPKWFEVPTMFRVDAVEGCCGVSGWWRSPWQSGSSGTTTITTRTIRSVGPATSTSTVGVSLWRVKGGDLSERPQSHRLPRSIPWNGSQREDLAVLWDICVRPEHRRRGIGFRLFRPALYWAWATRCGQMDLETDSGNVAACRFYAGQGCELGAIHRFGYIGVSDVARYARLLRYIDL